MESSKWQNTLMTFFKEREVFSISQQENLLKESLDKFVEFVNKESRVTIQRKDSHIGLSDSTQSLRSEIEIKCVYFFNPLQIELKLDSLGRFVKINYSSTTKRLENENQEIEIAVNEIEILETLANILAKYNG
jgi:hypothetical protein